ncbi:MAG: cytidine deaminase [Acidobacteria bacterium]|nr:cytidine deaminase [Acidobacteriota bacterium]
MRADRPATAHRPDLVEPADLEPELRKLVEAAIRARANAHAPYSGFAVGAAAVDADLRLHRGCNVENSSYGLTVCAERVALFSAVADGASDIRAIAVAGPGHRGRPTPPCGACRQVIWDLAGDVQVLLATLDGQVEVWQAADLLPAAFGPDDLQDILETKDER